MSPAAGAAGERPETFDDGDTFEQDGYTFRVQFPRDESSGEPWKESDGHGVVSEWISRGGRNGRAKRPGERVLCEDHGSRRYYDVQATMAIALKDGWGLASGPAAGESKRAYAARAVEADYRYLRGWCTDDWCYVGVVVTHGSGCDKQTESVWGIESEAEAYLAETARELAGQIVERLQLAAEQARIDVGVAYGCSL